MNIQNPFGFITSKVSTDFSFYIEEFERICQALNSPNHLILSSPRKSNKTLLVRKAVEALKRPYAFIDLRGTVDTANLAKLIIRESVRQFPLEEAERLLRLLFITPTFSVNPISHVMDIDFPPGVEGHVLLKEALSLIENVGTDEKRMIVVFDEFQEILQLGKGIVKMMRAIMQEQSHVNYVFLGSSQSLMYDIFGKPTSPFFHFGQMMHLKADYQVEDVEIKNQGCRQRLHDRQSKNG